MIKELIEAIERLYPDSYDIAILNESKKDIDLMIVCKKRDYELSEIIKNTLNIILPIFEKYKIEIFVKSEHLGYINNPRRKLHLLFYPTYEFLFNTELPSYLSFIYSKAKFVLGNNGLLLDDHKTYQFEIEVKYPLRAMELYNYADIALTTLIYVECNSKIVPNKSLWLNFIYALRFSLFEIIKETFYENQRFLSWGWDEFIKELENKYPNQKSIISFFKKRDLINYNNIDLLKKYTYEYFKIIKSINNNSEIFLK